MRKCTGKSKTRKSSTTKFSMYSQSTIQSKQSQYKNPKSNEDENLTNNSLNDANSFRPPISEKKECDPSWHYGSVIFMKKDPKNVIENVFNTLNALDIECVGKSRNYVVSCRKVWTPDYIESSGSEKIVKEVLFDLKLFKLNIEEFEGDNYTICFFKQSGDVFYFMKLCD